MVQRVARLSIPFFAFFAGAAAGAAAGTNAELNLPSGVQPWVTSPDVAVWFYPL
jgi:hypothetical protein